MKKRTLELTPRILKLHAEGLPRKVIALRLGIHPTTVSNVIRENAGK